MHETKPRGEALALEGVTRALDRLTDTLDRRLAALAPKDEGRAEPEPSPEPTKSLTRTNEE